MSAEPPDSFAKLTTYRAAMQSLRRLCGLSVDGGDKSMLPGGGHSISFASAQATPAGPFSAIPAGGGILIRSGWVSCAGFMTWMPEAVYPTLSGGVFLQVQAEFAVSANAPGDPWDAIIIEHAPKLVALDNGDLGAHAVLADDDATSDESLSAADGVVNFPVAIWHAGSVISLYSGNLSIRFLPNGIARLTQTYGHA